MFPQRPLPSGYGAHTTAREVIGERRLDGITAIVTGGYAGIGLETTRVLAAAGAQVIVPARNRAKATEALAAVANVTLAELDLGVPATIDTFAARFGDRPLHLLVENAGTMAAPLSRDTRGLESQLAVNHVGHFQLFVRLLPGLQRAQGARVVALSSRGHARSAFDFEDPSFQHRPYDKMTAYGQSKTANVLFAVELANRNERESRVVSAGSTAISSPSAAHVGARGCQRMSPMYGARPTRTVIATTDLPKPRGARRSSPDGQLHDADIDREPDRQVASGVLRTADAGNRRRSTSRRRRANARAHDETRHVEPDLPVGDGIAI